MHFKHLLKKIRKVVRSIAIAALLLTGIVAGLLPAAGMACKWKRLPQYQLFALDDEEIHGKSLRPSVRRR